MTDFTKCPQCSRIIKTNDLVTIGSYSVKKSKGAIENLLSKLYVDKEVIMCRKCVEKHNDELGNKN